MARMNLIDRSGYVCIQPLRENDVPYIGVHRLTALQQMGLYDVLSTFSDHGSGIGKFNRTNR